MSEKTWVEKLPLFTELIGCGLARNPQPTDLEIACELKNHRHVEEGQLICAALGQTFREAATKAEAAGAVYHD